MYGGSHSHDGGSTGAHSHGTGSSGTGGVLVAILLIIAVGGGIISIVVHIISNHQALRHDSVLTREDMHIRVAKFSVACREIEEISGKQVVGPHCSSAVRSSTFLIRLRGVPPGVKFTTSEARGTYEARCTLIAGGSAEDGSGGPLVTGPTKQQTGTGGTQGVLLPSNTCVVSTTEPVQYVEIDINRWSISDSNTGYSYLIRKFIARVHQSWYTSDGSIYSP